jgi:hypothetical protein
MAGSFHPPVKPPAQTPLAAEQLGRASRRHWPGRQARVALLLAAAVAVGCKSTPLDEPELEGTAGTSGAPASGAGGDGGAGEETAGASGMGGAGDGPETVVTVFDQIPQFGIYVETDPQDYTPPEGVVMWSHGTEFVTKLSAQQKSQLGADLAARVTYFAQCDEYDRLGGLFFVVEPKGREPDPADPRIELVRFITPFSDYKQGALSTHVYPDADISAYAPALADPSQDVWLGIAGGSNPYNGDACTDTDGNLRSGVTADFAVVGFKYSVELVSTQPLGDRASVTLHGAGKADETMLPVARTFSHEGDEVSGHITVIVSGHGSAAGGNEYKSTQDTVTLDGVELGSFDTHIDCASFARFSPRGNPGIFKGNQTTNPRNWCPGALVPSHTFPATLTPGEHVIGLAVTPSTMPEGSYYSTSIAFSAP